MDCALIFQHVEGYMVVLERADIAAVWGVPGKPGHAAIERQIDGAVEVIGDPIAISQALWGHIDMRPEAMAPRKRRKTAEKAAPEPVKAENVIKLVPRTLARA